MVFNYTLPTNITNYVQIGTYLGDVSGGWFGMLIVLSTFMICAISFRDWALQTNMLAACWICFIVSTLLWLMDWLNFTVVVLFLIATAILMIWKPQPDYG